MGISCAAIGMEKESDIPRTLSSLFLWPTEVGQMPVPHTDQIHP
jgi:hypothetical protein